MSHSVVVAPLLQMSAALMLSPHHLHRLLLRLDIENVQVNPPLRSPALNSLLSYENPPCMHSSSCLAQTFFSRCLS